MTRTPEATDGVKAPTKRRSTRGTGPSVPSKKLNAPSARGSDTESLAGSAGARKRQKLAAVGRTKLVESPTEAGSISYKRAAGIHYFVDRFASAAPMQIIEVERRGIDSSLLKDLSKHLDIPMPRICNIIGVPKATAEKKVAANKPIAGASGHAALGLVRLLAIAKEIVESSTAQEAKHFDSAKWLGQWIELPQAALGGRKPADLIGTPTGRNVVARVLGAIESGTYQ